MFHENTFAKCGLLNMLNYIQFYVTIDKITLQYRTQEVRKVSKRTDATNWEVISRDETGAMVNIDYVCPHCGYSTGELILVGAGNVGCLDGSWETDQECGICGEAVIIVCH